MTPKEWLNKNDKLPHHGLDYYRNYYWFPEDKCFIEEQHRYDNALPRVIYDKLNKLTNYPDVKIYKTREAALEDFYQAFEKAIKEGWQPE